MAQRLKDEKKQAIIESALDLMLLKGIDNTDMRSIAQNANITTGNLYRYFKNKQELIDSISIPMMEKLQESVSRNSAGMVLFMVDDNIDLTEDRIGSEKLDDIIIKTMSDAYKVSRENLKVMKVLLVSPYIKEMISKWLSGAILNNKNISVKKSILIKTHLSSVVNSLNTLLELGLDISYEEFMDILRFYIPTLNKTLIEIWGNENV